MPKTKRAPGAADKLREIFTAKERALLWNADELAELFEVTL